jgi:hypothetical protein
VSNSIQIQNSRRSKVTSSRALSPIPPDTPSARFVCVQKDPSPKCWGLFYAAFNLILAAGAIEVQASRRLPVTTKQASCSSTDHGGGKRRVGISSSIVAQTGLRASALSICFACWTGRATGSPVRFPGECSSLAALIGDKGKAAGFQHGRRLCCVGRFQQCF